MGWSYTTKAGNVMARWSDYCRAVSGGSSNVFKAGAGGKEYFFEAECDDRDDGGIAVSVYARSDGRFFDAGVIGGDGSFSCSFGDNHAGPLRELHRLSAGWAAKRGKVAA